MTPQKPTSSREAIPILRALVAAHAQPMPATGSREPIVYLRHSGGATIQHHALDAKDVQGLDDALIEELASAGMLDIDYREHSLNFAPTALARETVEQAERILNLEPLADLARVIDAIKAQSEAPKKLAWPAVRPVLEALHDYWEAGGHPPHGVQLAAVMKEVPEEHENLWIATIEAFVAGDYLRPTTELEVAGLPGEVGFTDRARGLLAGWPGPPPEDLAENLLAVLASAAASTENPDRKRRLERVAETVRELGVSTAGEVLAKVILGA